MVKDRQEEGVREMRQVDRRYLVFYLRVFDGMSSKVVGHLLDISSKGIMLVCDNPIAINEDYRLRMRLPTEVQDASEIVFSATSRWCKQDENPDFFLVGFRIDELSPRAEENILKLINEFSYNSGH